MDKKMIIDKTAEYVKNFLKNDSTGHDWWHIFRVWKNAVHIAQKENIDLFIVELAALLHDIGDYKLHNGDEKVGRKFVTDWLENLQLEQSVIDSVMSIIDNMSFSKNVESKQELSKEGQVVQDADRLDAIGAIGIARCFMYGGHRGNILHDPGIKPIMQKSTEEYKKGEATSINHFYEKLLLLKGLMNTETAKKIAEKRDTFMRNYLQQFYSEWEGTS